MLYENLTRVRIQRAGTGARLWVGVSGPDLSVSCEHLSVQMLEDKTAMVV